jgi:hypothetical protein
MGHATLVTHMAKHGTTGVEVYCSCPEQAICVLRPPLLPWTTSLSPRKPPPHLRCSPPPRPPAADDGAKTFQRGWWYLICVAGSFQMSAIINFSFLTACRHNIDELLVLYIIGFKCLYYLLYRPYRIYHWQPKKEHNMSLVLLVGTSSTLKTH